MSSNTDHSTSSKNPAPSRRSRAAALFAGVPVAVLSFGALASPLALPTSATARTSVQLSAENCRLAATAAKLATDLPTASAAVLKWPDCAGD